MSRRTNDAKCCLNNVTRAIVKEAADRGRGSFGSKEREDSLFEEFVLAVEMLIEAKVEERIKEMKE